LQVFLILPGNGGPHAIFLPRQKRHASVGFLSGELVLGKELSPIDGDFGEFKRNSVGALDFVCDDELPPHNSLYFKESSIWEDSFANRSNRTTASWLLFVNFRVGGFI